VQINVDLDLPRDARYVPVMRNVTERLLSDLGAPDTAIEDIQIALSEACANVVRHAAGSRTYHVRLSVKDSGCDIEVADSGPGFDGERMNDDQAEPDAENGRGLQLMQALVDDLFVATDDGDNVVRLHKEWPPLNLSVDALDEGNAQHPEERGR